MTTNYRLSGPGASQGMGVETVETDKVSWSASGTFSLKMNEGTKPGTVIEQRLQLFVTYTCAAPGAATYSDQQLRDFLTAMLFNLSGSTAAGPLLEATGNNLGAGDIIMLNRVVLRTASQGSLDANPGSYTFATSGTMIIEIPLPHYDRMAGIQECPDNSLYNNNVLTGKFGVASVGSLGSGSAVVITGGVLSHQMDVLVGQTGKTYHKTWSKYVQSGQTDTPPAGKFRGVLISGSNVPNFNTAITALATEPNEDIFKMSLNGRALAPPELSNNAYFWRRGLERLGRGYRTPGVYEPSGLTTYTALPVFVPGGEVYPDNADGAFVLASAEQLATGDRNWLFVKISEA